MTHTRAVVLTAALLAIVTPLASGCTGAAAGVTPSASVTTAIQGWDHWFRLEWEPVVRPEGRQIDGYIYNNYGAAAGNVQILAQGMDASGNVVNQKIAWVPGLVPAMNRSYFKVTGLPAAPQYRVSVWAFDFVQSPSIPER
jgi:hypothetical protein